MSTIVAHPETDVVVMGLGATGGVVSAELTTAGYKVVGLEKGPYWSYETDFAAQKIHDEWAMNNKANFDNPPYLYTFTLRNNSTQFALPGRRPGVVFAMGHGVGGMQTHWQAVLGRASPWSFAAYSNTLSRYGPGAATTMLIPNHDLEDFPLTYDDYAPYYAAFEQSMGVSGTNQDPFTPNAKFQLPPHPVTPVGSAFGQAAAAIGYHPFPGPSGICSAPYVNQYGIARNACVYCGFCNECETGAKANSGNTTIPAAAKTGNLDMRLYSYAFRVDTDATGKATGVRYYDAQGVIHVQPARAIFSGLWGWNTIRMMAISGLGTPYNAATVTGSLGRGVCGYGETPGHATGVINIGGNSYSAGNSGAGGRMTIEDFQADNFDHTGLNFIGGGMMEAGDYLGSSPGNLNLMSGSNFGSAAKAKLKDTHLLTKITVSTDGGGPAGDRMPLTTHYVDLDPHYTDIYGDPLARATIDTDVNRIRIGNYIAPFYANILTKMGCTNVTVTKVDETKIAGSNQTWGSHYRGGARTGINPETSVVNKWLQSWSVQNFFTAGELTITFGSAQSPGTHSAGMQAYLAADGIKKYLENPGFLV